jgi:DNA-binding XRE family transcriptional regulator
MVTAMDWDLTQKRLAADEENWASIARAVGLPRMTISRIGSGETPAPRVDTAQKIADYYARLDAGSTNVSKAA